MFRPAVLGLLLLLLAAAVAVAASGILVGDPIKPFPGATFVPTKGLGIPVKGSAKLLSLRVADPDSGPPWGMRFERTTRGLGCVQIGRIVDGRLGVLGQDGAFANDGKFHELPGDVLDRANCTLLDRNGHIFLAIGVRGAPASAMRSGCAAERSPAPPLPRPSSAARELPLCDQVNLRTIYYGTLGPQARSVTYDAPHGRQTATVARPQGAYLVVTRPAPGFDGSGGVTLGVAPGSGLTSVRYADGHVCRIPSARRLGGAKTCPPVGYVAPRRPRVTSAQVASPIRAKVVPGDRGQQRIEISFVARVAVHGGDSSYGVLAPSPRGCGGGGTAGAASDDVAAGERVRMTVSLAGGCAGVVHGEVVFSYNAPLSPLPFVVGPARRGIPLVGRFTVRVPG